MGYLTNNVLIVNHGFCFTHEIVNANGNAYFSNLKANSYVKHVFVEAALFI